jgi:hypothetical protein
MGRCRQNCGFVRKKVTRVVDVSADTTHATRVDDFCDRHVQKSISGNIVCIDEAGFVVGDLSLYALWSRPPPAAPSCSASMRRDTGSLRKMAGPFVRDVSFKRS